MPQRPTLKPTPKKLEPLTAAIIADMAPGEERGDAQVSGLRVRCSATGKKVFFYRYRSQDGTLREIILGEVGPLTLAKARDAALKKRLERQQGKDPQLEKRRAREEAMRERAAQRPPHLRRRGALLAAEVGGPHGRADYAKRGGDIQRACRLRA